MYTTETTQWEDKKWQLRVTDRSIEALLLSGEDKNVFSLEPRSDNGKIVYFRMKFEPGQMAPCWNDCILFRRGVREAPAVAPPLSATPTLLQIADAALKVNNEIKHPQHGFQHTAQRLEGDIVLPANPAVPGVLTLYQVPRAIGGTDALLALSFNSDDGANPGGIGGGGSVRV